MPRVAPLILDVLRDGAQPTAEIQRRIDRCPLQTLHRLCLAGAVCEIRHDVYALRETA